MNEHVIKDYMSGNTHIIIRNDYIVSDDENDRIYERMSLLIRNAYSRIAKEKDTPTVQSKDVSNVEPL